jgi:rubrerythrin
MGFKLKETIEGEYYDIAEVWECSDCGRTYYLNGVGGDCPACCSCEFENE